MWNVILQCAAFTRDKRNPLRELDQSSSRRKVIPRQEKWSFKKMINAIIFSKADWKRDRVQWRRVSKWCGRQRGLACSPFSSSYSPTLALMCFPSSSPSFRAASYCSVLGYIISFDLSLLTIFQLSVLHHLTFCTF